MAQASFWDGRSRQPRVDGVTRAEMVVTECWKSWSQAFACSKATLSAGLLSALNAETTACASAMSERKESLLYGVAAVDRQQRRQEIRGQRVAAISATATAFTRLHEQLKRAFRLALILRLL